MREATARHGVTAIELLRLGICAPVLVSLIEVFFKLSTIDVTQEILDLVTIYTPTFLKNIWAMTSLECLHNRLRQLFRIKGHLIPEQSINHMRAHIGRIDIAECSLVPSDHRLRFEWRTHQLDIRTLPCVPDLLTASFDAFDLFRQLRALSN
ncbi:hypothetical protein WS48_15115 [Burkholderia sp. RF7-non_BP1]|nr:hypothetical protein WS45_28665 [Burkholderia sp. RF2-non_BP3]KUY79118.1 hypothetical protein WS46_20025 [Burkholderia sp. RF4-BP95]KUY96928.1 hypothetical protein WS48_15115 [Burkholderia sp. RF7-non_BP1]KUZ05013.1 hypothetical protein WS49_07190 [Burkholderia sp. RF7-non_BP4]